MSAQMNSRAVVGLVLLGSALAAGLLLNVLACSLFGVWWSSFSAIPYLAAPLVKLCFDSCEPDGSFSTSSSPMRPFGNFLAGAFVVSGLSLPLVLAHAEIIENDTDRIVSAVLSLTGGITIYASVIAYIHFYHEREEEEE
mmetsp:Transcript_11341/g.28600  ORF Transcript_11341/g.28600 Transcript_11341/m.28600 type:complete len:140 (+) Transcript_11341:60-479(+)